MSTPFDLNNDSAYQYWRDKKLAAYPQNVSELIVEVKDLTHPDKNEIQAIHERLSKSNMAIYVTDPGILITPETLKQFGGSFGLKNLDKNKGADDQGVTSITVEDDWKARYIPYTNKPISWHTDGYYNASDKQVHALILHCVQDAEQGGSNQLLDHEMLYIHLREKNPDVVRALMADTVMTIPGDVVDGEIKRIAETGPVFSLTSTGDLHMRYTARKRNIIWKDTRDTIEATESISAFLNRHKAPILHGRLEPGQGLIANNVLHDRDTFVDSQEQARLLYRLRFYDRIN